MATLNNVQADRETARAGRILTDRSDSQIADAGWSEFESLSTKTALENQLFVA
jgi:hypothetical protein